ncbi:MAG TPA: bis(5'-nucleosyl)-tetraphosphatase (symmetrical) YqeK [Candidatus Mcinerneyibacterium sp.]|nr:bis(5'-nucleosyl)-tetraphosphatase (symmetrical) YqeK [Candidatus Mcinerneyibacterium sp.]
MNINVDKNNIQILKKYLKNKRRIDHSVSTAKEMIKYSKKYNINSKQAEYAGIFHDLAKDFSDKKLKRLSLKSGHGIDPFEKYNPTLLHSYVSAYITEQKVSDISNEALSAIENHTLGDVKMSKMEKLLYIIDFSEPERNYPEAKMARKLLNESIEDALFYVVRTTIVYLINENRILHPKSIKLYNYLVSEGGFHGKIYF